MKVTKEIRSAIIAGLRAAEDEFPDIKISPIDRAVILNHIADKLEAIS